MNSNFRPRKYYRNVAMIGLAFCLMMAGIAGGLTLTEDAEWPPALGVSLIVSLWFFLVAIHLWLLAAYWRESLQVSQKRLIQVGVVGRRDLQLDDVVKAQWKITPVHGSLVLRTDGVKMRIWFDNFERDERLLLIRWLRQTIPPVVQHGWTMFCGQIALPLRDEHDDSKPPTRDQRVITRRRWDLYFLVFAVVTIQMGVGVWWWTGTTRCLTGVVGLVPFWLFMRFSTPRKGIVEPANSRFDLIQMLFPFCWSGAALALAAVAAPFIKLNTDALFADIVVVFGVVLWLVGILRWAHRIDQKQRNCERRSFKLANLHWIRGEKIR